MTLSSKERLDRVDDLLFCESRDCPEGCKVCDRLVEKALDILRPEWREERDLAATYLDLCDDVRNGG